MFVWAYLRYINGFRSILNLTGHPPARLPACPPAAYTVAVRRPARLSAVRPEPKVSFIVLDMEVQIYGFQEV